MYMYIQIFVNKKFFQLNPIARTMKLYLVHAKNELCTNTHPPES